MQFYKHLYTRISWDFDAPRALDRHSSHERLVGPFNSDEASVVASHLTVPTRWHAETAAVAVVGSATPGTLRDTLIFLSKHIIIGASPGSLDLTFACIKFDVGMHMTGDLVSVSA